MQQEIAFRIRMCTCVRHLGKLRNIWSNQQDEIK